MKILEYDGYQKLSQNTDAEEEKIVQFQGQGQSESDKISKKDVLLVMGNWDTKVATVEEEMQPHMNSKHVSAIFKKNIKNHFTVLKLTDRESENFGMKPKQLLKMNMKRDYQRPRIEERKSDARKTVKIGKKPRKTKLSGRNLQKIKEIKDSIITTSVNRLKMEAIKNI